MNRVANALGQMGRAAPGPLIVRLIAGVAAFTGMFAALPTAYADLTAIVFLFGLSALTVAFIASALVTAVMLGTIGLWVMATEMEPVGQSRLFVVACALYVLQSSSTLAAALPFDAIVDSQVYLRWLARAGLVLLSAAALMYAVGTLIPQVRPQPSGLLVAGGLGAVALTIVVLSRLTRRM